MAARTLIPSRRPLPNISATRTLLVPRRTFLSNPFSDTTNNSSTTPSSPSQSLSAHRTLPYPAYDLFKIIADISNYPSFLPFCRTATVTSHSEPDAHYQTKWPSRATLNVGYTDTMAEKFTSRVVCVPPLPASAVSLGEGKAVWGFVEAVSGTGIQAGGGSDVRSLDASHYTSTSNSQSAADEEDAQSPLAMLRTRWTLRPHPFQPGREDGASPMEASLEKAPSSREMTDVGLSIEYKFRNPMYEVMARAAAPKVADMMVEAFETRAKEVLGKAKDADGR